MLQTTFTFEDALAIYTGIGSNDRKVPTRLITRTDFPEAPEEVIGLPVPIPYGDLSNDESVGSPPNWVQVPARGTTFSGTDWVLGHGDIAQPPAPPTNVNATAVGSGGSLMLGDVPGNRYYVVVTAWDGDVESDPDPFLFDGESAVISADNSRIDVTWTASVTGSPILYRAYIGMFYYGVRWNHRIETAATSCTFDAVPAFGVVPTTSNISTGGELLVGSSVHYYYAVTAMMPDGETPKSVIAIHQGGGYAPYLRPVHLEWTAVAGATSYRIYKKTVSAPGYIWRFDITGATDFDDDLSNATATDITGLPAPAGLLPAVPVGPIADNSGFIWQGFLIAGCAIVEVTRVFQNGVPIDAGSVGITFAVPGQTGFSTYFGSDSFVDINGRRYTLMYVRGPHSDIALYGPITVTLKGIELTGDGTGALITQLPEQYEHFLRNFVLRTYDTGAWSTDGPTWGDSPIDVDLVDGTSFDTAEDVWAGRGVTGSPGEIPGAWVCGMGETGTLEQQTVRTWLARLNQSVDGYGGFSRKSQYVIKLIDELADTTTSPRFTATLGINGDSFAIEDRPDEIENFITCRYALDSPNSIWSTVVVEDTDAQDAIGGEIKTYTLSLWCIRSTAVASEIVQRRLNRRKFPYRLVRWESDMGALMVDLGDIVKVSHPDGAGPLGWTDRLVYILRHEFNPQRFVVELEGLDLGGLLLSGVTFDELLLETGDEMLQETGDEILLDVV